MQEDTLLQGKPVVDLEFPSPPNELHMKQTIRILRNPMYESNGEEEDSQNVSMEEAPEGNE